MLLLVKMHACLVERNDDNQIKEFYILLPTIVAGVDEDIIAQVKPLSTLSSGQIYSVVAENRGRV